MVSCVPQGELRTAENKLGQTNQELEALSMDFLKKTANQFREFFLRSLGSVIHGQSSTNRPARPDVIMQPCAALHRS